jgi:hypothetical protein
MTEDTKDVSVAGEEEVTAPPTPEISAGSPPVSSEQPGVEALAARLDKFEKAIESLPDLVDSRVKSVKDVRFNKVEEIAAWVEESGGDFDKIKGALTESQLLNRVNALEAQISGGAPGRATTGVSEEKVNKILEEAGLDRYGDVANEWAAKKYPSEGEALAELTRLSVKAVKQGNVSAAAAVSPSGGAAPIEDDSYEGLAAQLAGMRGKYDPETTEKRRHPRGKA